MAGAWLIENDTLPGRLSYKYLCFLALRDCHSYAGMTCEKGAMGCEWGTFIPEPLPSVLSSSPSVASPRIEVGTYATMTVELLYSKGVDLHWLFLGFRVIGGQCWGCHWKESHLQMSKPALEGCLGRDCRCGVGCMFACILVGRSARKGICEPCSWTPGCVPEVGRPSGLRVKDTHIQLEWLIIMPCCVRRAQWWNYFVIWNRSRVIARDFNFISCLK